MQGDPKGYYAFLGVSVSASTAEIKSAYHKLAKSYHPDVNKAADAAAKFKVLYEAYSVLNNPKSRDQYDASAAAQKTPDADHSQTVELVVCHKCAKIAVQPRYAAFRRTVSLLFVTHSSPIQGVFCSACARKTALQASLVSSLFGWWGFPWGPIYTIRDILLNARGGERPKGAEQQLLWTNAIGFFQRNDRLLAFALAKRVQGLDGSELSTHASDLISYLVKSGVPRDTPTLNNPWSKRTPEIFGHAVLLLIMPVLLIVLIAASKQTSSPTPNIIASSGRPIDEMPATPAIEAAPSSRAAPVTAPEPTCASPPDNGEILGGERPDESTGHKIEIKNGSSGPAIIKVRDISTNKMVFSFFVAKDATASVRGLPDGTYKIQYATGDSLAADCRSLVGDVDIDEFPDEQTLTTKYLPGEVEFAVLSYTLYTVPGGNVHPRSIDQAEFNAE